MAGPGLHGDTTQGQGHCLCLFALFLCSTVRRETRSEKRQSAAAGVWFRGF